VPRAVVAEDSAAFGRHSTPYARGFNNQANKCRITVVLSYNFTNSVSMYLLLLVQDPFYIVYKTCKGPGA
jgi:hypothetical protein